MGKRALVERAVEKVEKAARRLGKRALGRMADVPEATLRGLGTPEFNPRRSTLVKLEEAVAAAEDVGKL